MSKTQALLEQLQALRANREADLFAQAANKPPINKLNQVAARGRYGGLH